jgi:predicted O-methyltransferase YrrM
MGGGKMIRDKLYPYDIYQGFVAGPTKWGVNWQGDKAIFGGLVKSTQPNVIIEVGSWYGMSAVNMAKAAPEHTEVICVDTWLGPPNALLQHGSNEPFLQRRHGFPQFYYQFLANVRNAGVEGKVTPLPLPSEAAARILAKLEVKAELIYIDGDHEEEPAYRDLLAYSKLLAPGGVLFVHDYEPGHAGVMKAVDRFAWDNDVKPEVQETWAIFRGLV